MLLSLTLSSQLCLQEAEEDVENLGENEEKLTAAAYEQRAGGMTDHEADSSWLVSTEMVPIEMSGEEDNTDAVTAQGSPDESPVPSGFNACLAVRRLTRFVHACTLSLPSIEASCLQLARSGNRAPAKTAVKRVALLMYIVDASAGDAQSWAGDQGHFNIQLRHRCCGSFAWTGQDIHTVACEDTPEHSSCQAADTAPEAAADWHELRGTRAAQHPPYLRCHAEPMPCQNA